MYSNVITGVVPSLSVRYCVSKISVVVVQLRLLLLDCDPATASESLFTSRLRLSETQLS